MLSFWRRFAKSEHRRAQELLSAYIDGEVSPSERALVEAHIKGCPQCQRELASLRMTAGVLRHMPSLALPRSFILREVPGQRRASGLATSDRAWAYLRGATALAAMLLAFVFTTELYRQRLDPTLTPVTLVAPVALKPAEAPMETVTAPALEAGEAVFAGIEATPTKEAEKLVTIEVEKAMEREVVVEREVEEVAAEEMAVEREAEKVAEREVTEKAAEPQVEKAVEAEAEKVAEREALKEALVQDIPATPEPETPPEVRAPARTTPPPKDEALLASPPAEKEEPRPVLASPPPEREEVSPVAVLEEATPAPIAVHVVAEEREGPSVLRWIEAGLLGILIILAAATLALARKRRSFHL